MLYEKELVIKFFLLWYFVEVEISFYLKILFIFRVYNLEGCGVFREESCKYYKNVGC